MIGGEIINDLGVIIIGAAVCLVVARQLGLPSIIAYLLAGLVLGPWTGLVEITHSLRIISEIGIVLLLFLVGLELSFDKIKGMGKAALIAGTVQLVVTAAGGFALAHFLGFGLSESLFLSVAFTFSSTVIAVKLLEDKHQFDTRHGRIAVGILLFQDLAVIVLLTLMDGIQPGAALDVASVSANVATTFGGMAVLVVVALWLARYALPRPFSWAARSPATLFIWSLCWCFFVVAGAHLLHLSHETGAFLAGVSLAQLPYNHDLRRRVHPIMNFFVAVFFVSLGIQIQLGSALAQWPVAVAFAAYVLVGKFLIIGLTLGRLGFSRRNAWLAGLTLSQISEFSFLFAAAGIGAGWIEPSLLSLIGLVGLITFSLSACAILANQQIYRLAEGSGLARILFARGEEPVEESRRVRRGHVIVVGMNTLGRSIARRLHERGENVLAIDTDPHKLAGLPCESLLGNVEYLSVLEEASLETARLLVSALRIEPTNDLLAYRARAAGVRSGINVVDFSTVETLLEMQVNYLMIPKVDGIKLQTKELKRLGFLPS